MNRKLVEIKLIKKALPYINIAKRVSFPGFDKVPVFNVALFFYRGIRDGAITTRAAAVAFSLILAFFPAIIFLFTLIPMIPITNFQSELLLLIQSIVPVSTYEIIQQIIEDIITIKHGGFLSIGFILALAFSTNGIVSLIESFNASVHVEDTRSWIMQRAIALLLVVILSLLVTIGISMITFTHTVLDFLVSKGLMKLDWIYYMVAGGKWFVILGVFYFAFSFFYYLGPAEKSKYRFISAGASLATVLTILITLGFGFYIDQFGSYNALYGSIGTLPAIMLMIYFNCLAIILGFELNIGIIAARKLHLSDPLKD
ncbi:YihY/virulence factor BrkB family protein [bacterium]|nr:YihY/virulence factor BrkB family protein [bacterium]